MKYFEKVIGYEKEKTELLKVIDHIKNIDQYEEKGVKLPNGILLYGVPGVGKSLIASEFIKACDVPHFICRKKETDGKFTDKIVQCFEDAYIATQKNGVAIVLLEDMDKFANEDQERRDAEEYVTVQSCIDDMKDENIIVIATVNDMGKLPRSLIRPGRFDIKLDIRIPSRESREKIVEKYLGDAKVEEDMDFETLSDIMEGSSCATLEAMINDALRNVAYRREDTITLNDLVRIYFDYREKITITDEPIKYDSSYTKEHRARVAYHEAGHLVMIELLRPGYVAAVGIDDYNRKGMTVMRKLPVVDEADYDYGILKALAGKAAEELKFKGHGDGARADMQHAFDLADDKVSELVAYGWDKINMAYTWSTESDNEIRRNCITSILGELYSKAQIMLAENIEFLDKIAQATIDRKLLLRKDIQKIKATCDIKTEYVNLIA